MQRNVVCFDFYFFFCKIQNCLFDEYNQQELLVIIHMLFFILCMYFRMSFVVLMSDLTGTPAQ